MHNGVATLPAEMRRHRGFVRLLRRRVNDAEFMEAINRLRDSVLRTTLRIRQKDRGLVIALAGARGGEGTSLLSLLLSLSLGANRHQKVAFLDGLFSTDRFEVLSQVFGLSRDPTAAQNGTTPLSGCFSQDQPNTCFLKSDSIQHGFDFFADKRLGGFLSDLRRTYDFTIIDMPPLLKGSLKRHVDHAVLCMEDRTTGAGLFRCRDAAPPRRPILDSTHGPFSRDLTGSEPSARRDSGCHRPTPRCQARRPVGPQRSCWWCSAGYCRWRLSTPPRSGQKPPRYGY